MKLFQQHTFTLASAVNIKIEKDTLFDKVRKHVQPGGIKLSEVPTVPASFETNHATIIHFIPSKKDIKQGQKWGFQRYPVASFNCFEHNRLVRV